MHLRCIPIPDEDVDTRAKLVDEPTCAVLEKALAIEIVALTIANRERILRARRPAD